MLAYGGLQRPGHRPAVPRYGAAENLLSVVVEQGSAAHRWDCSKEKNQSKTKQCESHRVCAMDLYRSREWMDKQMDTTRKGKGGVWAPRGLELTENTVLATSWLKRRPLPPGPCVLEPLMHISRNCCNCCPEKKAAVLCVEILSPVGWVGLWHMLSGLAIPSRELGIWLQHIRVAEVVSHVSFEWPA